MKMRTASFAVLALAVIALCAGSKSARADLIVNGGFEFPGINTFYQNYGAFTNNPYSGLSFDPAWAIPLNNVDIVNPFIGWGAPAYQGNQVLDLVGFGSTGAISQTFNTLPGQQYLLSFAFGNNPGSTSAASADVAVFGSGSLLSAIVFHNTSTNGNLNWNVFSGSFVADSASTTLSFNTVLGGNNGGILLDAVSVSAVPEPATWAMMILGFAGLALVAYRRSRKTAAAAISA